LHMRNQNGAKSDHPNAHESYRHFG